MEDKMQKNGVVLIVDDTPASISLIRTVLKEEGYQVRIATSGKVAIERILAEAPDIILLDIMMPGMDGFETCKEIKNLDTPNEIPVIFLSALADTLDKVKAFNTGAVDYLIKPVEPQELLVRINTHIRFNRLERELQATNKYLEERVNARTDELLIVNTALKNEILKLEKTECDLVAKENEIRSAISLLGTKEDEIRNNFNELKKSQEALAQARKKLNVFNTVTFQDIENAVFCLSGYLNLEKTMINDANLIQMFERDLETVRRINHSLQFAKNFQDLGINPPLFQNVMQVFLFAISHIDFSNMKKKVSLNNLEIYADPLLEKAFLVLAENVIKFGGGATEISFSFERDYEVIKLIFEDNGVGIPVENKENIFEREFGERKGGGLFLAKEILDVTRISIKETGEQGKGARFEMIVPEGNYRFNQV